MGLVLPAQHSYRTHSPKLGGGYLPRTETSRKSFGKPGLTATVKRDARYLAVAARLGEQVGG